MAGVTSISVGHNAEWENFPFYVCESLDTLILWDAYPPDPIMLDGQNAPLQRILVPEDSYDAYVQLYGDLIPADAQILPDPIQRPVPEVKLVGLSDRTVTLSWSAHISPDVIGYIVQRDNVIVADTTDLHFTDTVPENDVSYQYTVYGYCANGRRTELVSLYADPRLDVDSKRNGYGRHDRRPDLHSGELFTADARLRRTAQHR